MSSLTLDNAVRQSLRILRWQAIWVVVAALMGGALFGVQVGRSMLAGGAIGLVWTAYMAFTLFRHSASKAARLGVASFVTAWLVKLVLTLGLMVIAFRSKAMTPPGLIVGLFVALVAYWAWLAFGFSRRARSSAGGSGIKG